MFLILIGPSCSGKSSIAGRIAAQTGAEIWAGRDYLRLAKSESLAWAEFERIIKKAADNDRLGPGSIIYLVTEKTAVRPSIAGLQNTRVIAVTAEASVLKERFSRRTGRPLTPPLAMMIDRQLGSISGLRSDMTFDTSTQAAEMIAERIIKNLATATERERPTI